jgi:hypothetical protein
VDHHHRARGIGKVLFTPEDRFRVQMVGTVRRAAAVGAWTAAGDTARRGGVRRPKAPRRRRRPGGQRRAFHGDFDGALDNPSHGAASIFSLHLRLFGDQGVHLVVGEFLGEAGGQRLEAVQEALDLGGALLTLPSTSFVGSRCGSCSR